jgi:hypothetical protein
MVWEGAWDADGATGEAGDDGKAARTNEQLEMGTSVNLKGGGGIASLEVLSAEAFA